MFGFFQSRQDRATEAVVEFLRYKIEVPDLPAAAVVDRYCLGFLQMVGVHVASQSLPQGSGMEQAKTIFRQALLRLAPLGVREAVDTLPLLDRDEAFLRGTRDGDLYMGWKLLKIAPEHDGEAALRRFFQRVGEVASSPKVGPTVLHSSQTTGTNERRGTRGSVSWTDWTAEDKNAGFDGSAKQEICRTYIFTGMNAPKATLSIVCALEVTAMPDGESVSLERKLSFHLQPFRLPHEADFVMRLATRDEAQGGEFDVVAAPIGSNDDTAVIAKYGGRNDVATCVATLQSGRDVVFMLRDERETLVNFLLPNDATF
jgi:hypothetical protein